MNKEELRKHYLKKRKALSSEEVDQYSHAITQKLTQLDIWKSGLTVHCFLPITSNNEFNTLPFINFLWEQKCKVVVPISNFETKQMDSALFTPNTNLNYNHKIPEPTTINLIDSNTIDVIIVPLTIADKNGFRIGYGGGFYDRFMEQFPISKRIGVSFFDLIESISPDTHDQKLNELITPNNQYSTKVN